MGPRAAARLGIDRVDVTIRELIGRSLGTDALRHSSRRRAEATEHREQALRLRRQAEDELASAQEQLEETDGAAVAPAPAGHGQGQRAQGPAAFVGAFVFREHLPSWRIIASALVAAGAAALALG